MHNASIVETENEWLVISGVGLKGDKGDTGSAGVIQEVIAGANVTVDNTDPARPIISATGGGGGGTGAVDSVNGQTGVVVLTKSDVGLSNADNTSDVNKPISAATQTALNAKQDTLVSATSIKTINGNSVLGSGDLVISSPVQSVTGTAVTGTSTNPVVNLPTADQVTETANKVFVSPAEKAAITHSNRNTLDLITEAFTTALKSTYDAVVAWVTTNGSNVLAHLSRTDNLHSVTKSQVGLSNVDNTTDLLKPISTATQTALNAKQDTIVNSDSITQGSTNLFLSASERAKLVNTSGTNSGDNATNTTSNTYADSKVADAIVDGVTTVAPSQNAVFDALALKQNTITNITQIATRSYNDLQNLPTIPAAVIVDASPVDGSSNAVSSNGVFDALANKQDTLVSATNIKTINGNSVLGSGDLVISGGGGGIADAPNDTNAYVRSALSWVVGYNKTDTDTLLGNKVDKTTWIDYSNTSTIVGFSSFTAKHIWYKVIDGYMFVDFWLFGTSNSTEMTFTVPFVSAEGFEIYRATGYIINQGGVINAPGRSSIANGSNVVILRRDFVGANTWATTSSKGSNGQISFKI